MSEHCIVHRLKFFYTDLPMLIIAYYSDDIFKMKTLKFLFIILCFYFELIYSHNYSIYILSIWRFKYLNNLLAII